MMEVQGQPAFSRVEIGWQKNKHGDSMIWSGITFWVFFSVLDGVFSLFCSLDQIIID